MPIYPCAIASAHCLHSIACAASSFCRYAIPQALLKKHIRARLQDAHAGLLDAPLPQHSASEISLHALAHQEQTARRCSATHADKHIQEIAITHSSWNYLLPTVCLFAQGCWCAQNPTIRKLHSFFTPGNSHGTLSPRCLETTLTGKGVQWVHVHVCGHTL